MALICQYFRTKDAGSVKFLNMFDTIDTEIFAQTLAQNLPYMTNSHKMYSSKLIYM